MGMLFFAVTFVLTTVIVVRAFPSSRNAREVSEPLSSGTVSVTLRSEIFEEPIKTEVPIRNNCIDVPFPDYPTKVSVEGNSAHTYEVVGYPHIDCNVDPDSPSRVLGSPAGLVINKRAEICSYKLTTRSFPVKVEMRLNGKPYDYTFESVNNVDVCFENPTYRFADTLLIYSDGKNTVVHLYRGSNLTGRFNETAKNGTDLVALTRTEAVVRSIRIRQI